MSCSHCGIIIIRCLDRITVKAVRILSCVTYFRHFWSWASVTCIHSFYCGIFMTMIECYVLQRCELYERIVCIEYVADHDFDALEHSLLWPLGLSMISIMKLEMLGLSASLGEKCFQCTSWTWTVLDRNFFVANFIVVFWLVSLMPFAIVWFVEKLFWSVSRFVLKVWIVQRIRMYVTKRDSRVCCNVRRLHNYEIPIHRRDISQNDKNVLSTASEKLRVGLMSALLFVNMYAYSF